MNYQLNNIVSAARAVSFCGVDLYGKNLKQRAKELISIAHPNHREELEKETYMRLKN